MKKSLTNTRKGKGLFHDVEVQLHAKYKSRRALGWRVSYKWISGQMTILCKKLKPQGYDPAKHKFRQAWVRRFCKRWHISLRRKSNSKCSTVFERLHQIKNYDHWLIYQWQDPANYDGKYYSYDVYVNKIIPFVPADEDPDEVDFQVECESQDSSTT